MTYSERLEYEERILAAECEAIKAKREISEMRRLITSVLEFGVYHKSSCRYHGGHDCSCGQEELLADLRKASVETLQGSGIGEVLSLKEGQSRLETYITQGEEIEALLTALHDAINRPKGVVPESADKFYDQTWYDRR